MPRLDMQYGTQAVDEIDTGNQASKHGEIFIKSFVKYQHQSHDPQAIHLDLYPLFDGRFPKQRSYWNEDIPEKVSSLLLNQQCLQDLPQPIYLFFDCHLSIAFLAGHLINPKYNISVIPVQNDKIWLRPSEKLIEELWHMDFIGCIDTEVVVGVSVTHSVEEHLYPFLESKGLMELPKILAHPINGTGLNAIYDGDHAWHLGFELMTRLRKDIPNNCHTIHFFFAGPVALAYILGHTLRYVTKVTQLYEFDYEGTTNERYYPSICIQYGP